MTSGGYMYVLPDVKLHIQLSLSKFKMSMTCFFWVKIWDTAGTKEN